MEKHLIDNKEVLKSNNLIESSYKLSAMEQKIIYYGASTLNKIMINKDLSVTDVSNAINSANFPLINFNACDFQKYFNIKTGNIYTMMEEASDKLFERRFIYIDNLGVPVKKRWVITCRYDKDNARIQLQFHPDLIQDLLVFKDKFTIFKLRDTLDIKSGYAYRLYELLKKYEKFKMRYFSIEDFKFKLGMDDSEYEKYSSLKQNVIKPSIATISRETDLVIEYEEIKEKRKVVKIKFLIKSKGNKRNTSSGQMSFLENQNDIEDIIESDDSNLVYKLQEILKFDVTAGQAQKIINSGLESIEKNDLKMSLLDFIKLKKQVIDKYAEKNEIKSYVGMLLRAIESNWTNIVFKNEKVDTFNDYPQRQFDSNLEGKLLGWNRNIEDEVAIGEE